MPYVHMTTREIYFKIVYYGPGLSGKTTNVEQLHARTPAARRGNLISLKTESERTLFFDFMPFELGAVGGLKARLSLHNTPRTPKFCSLPGVLGGCTSGDFRPVSATSANAITSPAPLASRAQQGAPGRGSRA